jgi:hypothetical protein
MAPSEAVWREMGEYRGRKAGLEQSSIYAQTASYLSKDRLHFDQQKLLPVSLVCRAIRYSQARPNGFALPSLGCDALQQCEAIQRFWCGERQKP